MIGVAVWGLASKGFPWLDGVLRGGVNEMRCSITTPNDVQKQHEKKERRDCCRQRNRRLPAMSRIGQRVGAILNRLLFEADFFVDEKDLQTFVGATSQESRFFFAFFAPLLR